MLWYRSQHDSTDVHDGHPRLGARFDGQGLGASREFDGSDGAQDHVLEMSRLDHGELERLSSDLDIDLSPTAAIAASLLHFHLVLARLANLELPFGPVIRVGPVAQDILMRLGFVPHGLGMHDRVFGMQSNIALSRSDFRFVAAQCIVHGFAPGFPLRFGFGRSRRWYQSR